MLCNLFIWYADIGLLLNVCVVIYKMYFHFLLLFSGNVIFFVWNWTSRIDLYSAAFWVGCHHRSPLTTCYQCIVVVKYCASCVQIVWLLNDTYLVWGTSETRCDYFHIMNRAVSQACFWPAQQWYNFFSNWCHFQRINHTSKSCFL